MTEQELEQQIRISAEKTVNQVCRIKPGERVLIVTNRVIKQNKLPEAYLIARALYDACITATACPVLILQPEKKSLDAADPAVIAALKTKPSVFFSISENKLGKDPEGIQHPYTGPDGNSYDHIFDYLLYGKKSMRAVWTPGVTLDMFSVTVGIDYELLNRRCLAVSSCFKQAVTVRITAPAGTDITVPVEGRNPFMDNGAFYMPGTGGNIPAGEVFISPVVGDRRQAGCCGRIVFDGSLTLDDGDILIQQPVAVDVQGGFVTKITGGEEAARLREVLDRAEQIALQMEKDGSLPSGQGCVYGANARNIGELGIGLNPAARITGNMLEDEKAFTTCHFAIGANYDGDAPALIHLDGIVRNPTITVVNRDSSVINIMEEGNLLV